MFTSSRLTPSLYLLCCHHRIYDSLAHGVEFGAPYGGIRSKGRLEDCELWGNEGAGVYVNEGDPVLLGCIIRDHSGAGKSEGAGCGLFVRGSMRSMATVGVDNDFARNKLGDVVRLVYDGGQYVREVVY